MAQPIPSLLKTELGKPKKHELKELYWIHMLSEGQIAQKYQVEPETVVRWLIQYDIPLRGYYETIQLNFYYEGGVPATTEVVLQFQIPYDCTIKEVVLHFPEGCSGLVQASLQLSDGITIFPAYGDYIALDGATERFDFEWFLNTGSLLQAKISNTDSANAHNVQVIVTIRRLSVVSVG